MHSIHEIIVIELMATKMILQLQTLENVNDGRVCNKMFDPAKDLTLLAVYQASSTVYLGFGIFFLILTVVGPVCCYIVLLVHPVF